MYLLDTNICIFAMKNTYPVLSQKLFRIPPSEIFVSSVTVGELEYGCFKSKWGERTRNIMNLFLAAYTILPFDRDDAAVFGRIRADLAKTGSPIGPYDLQIAAQGIAKGLTIVTHNTENSAEFPALSLRTGSFDPVLIFLHGTFAVEHVFYCFQDQTAVVLS